MGICCENQTSTTNTVSMHGSKKKRVIRLHDIDTVWHSSYAGRVLAEIKRLHYDPSSFVNSLDRVYEDLVTQLATPSTQDEFTTLLRKQLKTRREGPDNDPELTLKALEATEPPPPRDGCTADSNACDNYRDIQSESRKLCYEYCLPKIIGMSAEECVLFAIALDFEQGIGKESPLLRDDIDEIGVEVRSGSMSDVVRILVVTNEEMKMNDVA